MAIDLQFCIATDANERHSGPCKALYPGSIPGAASRNFSSIVQVRGYKRFVHDAPPVAAVSPQKPLFLVPRGPKLVPRENLRGKDGTDREAWKNLPRAVLRPPGTPTLQDVHAKSRRRALSPRNAHRHRARQLARPAGRRDDTARVVRRVPFPYSPIVWECQANLAPPRSSELAPPRGPLLEVTQSSTGVRLSFVRPA